MRTRPPHDLVPEIPPTLIERAQELDEETPPPDHADFLAVQANGLRAIGRRWEMRRRLKRESLAQDEK